MNKTKPQRIVNLIMMIILSFILMACDSKEKSIHDLIKLRAEVKEHCAEYTEAEWEDAYNRYKEICIKLDKMDFTEEEREEINKIEGEIAGYAATVFAQEMMSEMQNIGEEIIDFTKKMQSFEEGFNKTYEEPKIKNRHDW